MGKLRSASQIYSGKFTYFHKLTQPFTPISQPIRLSLLLLLSVVLLFGPAINFEFLNYDDPINIYENRLITQFVPAKMASIWSRPIHGLYIPLTYTAWGLLGRLAAWLHPSDNPTIFDPAVFHAVNIALHAGNTLLVFAILRLLLKRDRPAVFGALLFAFHPLQVDAVAWASELKGLLAGFLGLLAIWHYLRHAATAPPTTFQLKRRYLLASGFFFAALFAKPCATCLPLMAAVPAILLLKRDWHRVALELAPWLLLATPMSIINKCQQPSEMLSFIPSLWQRILVAGDAITFYHTKLIWPFGLGPDYGRTAQEVLASDWIYLTGLLPFGVAALLFWRVRRPWPAAGGLLFVAALLPVLGFIPFGFQNISTVADRYLYLAMLAPALLLGRLLCLHPGRAATVTAAVLLLLLSARSADSLRYWQDSLTFNLRAVELNPKSYLAYNNLGTTYMEQGRLQDAIAAFNQSIANAPDRAFAYANLGKIYAARGLHDEAKACYLKALENQPSSPGIHLQLGVLASSDNKHNEAFEHFRKALELDPELAPAYGYLGILHTQLNQFDEAIANYRKALHLDPHLAAAHNNLGLLYKIKGSKIEAMTAFRQAIRLQPESPDAFNNLGLLLIEQNRSEEAIPLLRQAVALAPEQPNPAYNLGLACLNMGRTAEAAEWFRLVLCIDPGFVAARANLASAEALAKAKS